MQTVDRLRRIIAEILGVPVENIRAQDTFASLMGGREPRLSADLGADSLDAIEFMLAVEKEFALDIPDDEAENIIVKDMSLTQIAEYIDRHRKNGGDN